MRATIQIVGKKYSAQGETAQEAIAGLSYKGFSKLKSTLTMDYGDKEKTVVLYPLQTARLFSTNALMREIAIKGIALKF